MFNKLMDNKSNLSLIIDAGGWEETVTFWIEGVLTPIVSIAGIIGNYDLLVQWWKNRAPEYRVPEKKTQRK